MLYCILGKNETLNLVKVSVWQNYLAKKNSYRFYFTMQKEKTHWKAKSSHKMAYNAQFHVFI